MNIEVDDNYESFKDSLEAKGFTYLKSYRTCHTFYGKFANEIVKLEALASPKTNTMCKIIIYFPEKDNWFNLKEDYFEKKELYRSKYPLDVDYEFFKYPYEDGDGYEMRAIELDKCRYISFFLATGGYITIEINDKAQVRVTYEDRDNTRLAQEELEQQAIDDI